MPWNYKCIPNIINCLWCNIIIMHIRIRPLPVGQICMVSSSKCWRIWEKMMANMKGRNIWHIYKNRTRSWDKCKIYKCITMDCCNLKSFNRVNKCKTSAINTIRIETTPIRDTKRTYRLKLMKCDNTKTNKKELRLSSRRAKEQKATMTMFNHPKIQEINLLSQVVTFQIISQLKCLAFTMKEAKRTSTK